MKRIILISLALLPLAAHAQSATTSGAAMPAPVMLTASLTRPAGVAPESNAPAPVSTAPTRLPAAHELIKTIVDPDFATANVMGSNQTFGSPNQQSAPQLTTWKAIGLSADALAARPPQSTLEVRMLVNRIGIPEDLRITHSAGTAIDASALATIRDYRFKPATVDRLPIEAVVTLNVLIEKR